MDSAAALSPRYLLAAFLDNPIQFVGLCIVQAACGTAQNSFVLFLAGKMEPMNVIGNSLQPFGWERFKFFNNVL